MVILKKSLVNSLAWSSNSGLPWRKGRDTFSNYKKFEWHNISPGRIPKISFKRSTAKTWLTHACWPKTSLQTHDEYQVHVYLYYVGICNYQFISFRDQEAKSTTFGPAVSSAPRLLYSRHYEMSGTYLHFASFSSSLKWEKQSRLEK